MTLGLLAWHGDGLRFMRDPLFNSLADLVEYFSKEHINEKSGLLTHPCPPEDKKAIDDLFDETLAFFG